ncbi:MAG TPA: hypothetical protein VKY57_06220 [Chitinispirillaceae bacterium]|nr:hypothetical protein [Chitinispirillaceae bacterium]
MIGKYSTVGCRFQLYLIVSDVIPDAEGYCIQPVFKTRDHKQKKAS